jgi:hypothetical protein
MDALTPSTPSPELFAGDPDDVCDYAAVTRSVKPGGSVPDTSFTRTHATKFYQPDEK